MGKRENKKKVIIEACLLVLIFVSLIAMNFVVGKVFTITAYPGTAPTIDGSIGNEEWKDGKETKILVADPWNMNPETQIIEIYCTAMYCNRSFLYLAIRAPIGSGATNLKLTMYFHSNTAEGFLYDETNVRAGNDAKIFVYAEDYCYDCVVVSYGGSSSYLFNDTERGGTTDCEGKCQRETLQSTVELKIPMSSGDEEGGDIDVQISDTIKCYIIIGSYKNENCELVISENAALPITPIIIPVGLAVMIMVKKAKNRKEEKSKQ